MTDTPETAGTESAPFIDKLDTASRIVSGLHVFEEYLSPEQAAAAYLAMNNSSDFPWNTKPRIGGESLKQHAYEYKRYKTSEAQRNCQKYAGLARLEQICQRLEKEFDGTIEEITCNRFMDSSHYIPWHQDTYGRHIFVLSLGEPRKVQFKHKKTKQVTTLEPSSGDLYFFPLRVNYTHKHRVRRGNGTRMSFVFFFNPPEYAKEYKITKLDKLKGRIFEAGVTLGFV